MALMRGPIAKIVLLFTAAIGFGQTAPTFAVASVKVSAQIAGRDRGDRISIVPTGLSARNATLKRLIVEAYSLQPHQVSGGPKWLDSQEYDVEAKADGPTRRGEIALMLRELLAERFQLKMHTETKDLRVYELVVDKNGPKISPSKEQESAADRFRGDLRQFANLLAVKLTIPVMDDPTRPKIAGGNPIPVLDKTGLTGIYDIDVDQRPEPGSDVFTLWQRFLQSQLGLKLESCKSPVELFVVDHAESIPIAN